MKRLLLGVLALMLCAQTVQAGLGDGLKKVLVIVPNERTQTGGMQLQVCSTIIQGGGIYEIMNLDTPADTTGWAAAFTARLRARVAAGDYGLIIALSYDAAFFKGTTASYAAYGRGVLMKHLDISRYPLGVPTLAMAKMSLVRSASELQIGADASSPTWTYAGAYDSLRAITAEGGEVLWWNGSSGNRQTRHLLDIDQAPESNYFWTVDYWPKSGVSLTHGGQGKSMYMWHVHRTAHDRDELPGAGQDSVIYYFPDWGGQPDISYDKIKALSALLKKYGCINYHPWSVYVDDWGYYNMSGHAATGVDSATAHLALRADTLMDWLEANRIYCEFNTGLYNVDVTQWPSNMAAYYQSQYLAFAWHPSTAYRTAAKTSGVDLAAWPVAMNGKTDSLYHALQLYATLLSSGGWDRYMDHRDVAHPGQYYWKGASGYRLQDSTLACYAAAGVDKFRFPSNTYAPYSATSQGFYYPHRDYPIDLANTVNETGWEYVDIIIANYVTAWNAANDSAFASPTLAHDSLIVKGSSIDGGDFYRYFAKLLLSNRRTKDGTGSWAGTDWPQWYNLECRGFCFSFHQYDTAVRTGRVSPTNPNGEIYNSMLVWMQHYYNNLDAYNAMARDDDPTIGDTFQCMFNENQPQRINARM